MYKPPPTISISLKDVRNDNRRPWQSPNAIGVNFAVQAAYYQNRPNKNLPLFYVEDSMKIFRLVGIPTIRVPFYWESYERSRQEFYKDLFHILEQASINDLQVVLDNHQWETGSWLGWGPWLSWFRPVSMLSQRFWATKLWSCQGLLVPILGQEARDS